jgi:hypothetical protein
VNYETLRERNGLGFVMKPGVPRWAVSIACARRRTTPSISGTEVPLSESRRFDERREGNAPVR